LATPSFGWSPTHLPQEFEKINTAAENNQSSLIYLFICLFIYDFFIIPILWFGNFGEFVILEKKLSNLH
jgi:hypothetical protein